MQGCIQRVFFGDVNAATVRVLSAPRAGRSTRPARRAAAARCRCTRASTRRRSRSPRRRSPPTKAYDRIVTNVAGCGSVMKDYGHILDTDRAREFSAKVVDVHELLASEEPQAVRKPIELRAAYHDACHLAHAPEGPPAAARAAARHPRARAARARRVGALLRLGRDLQPAPARGRGQARRAQGREPEGHRRGRDRRRQPRLRAADRALPRPPHLPPDDPARHVP